MPRKPRSGYTPAVLPQRSPTLAARIMPPPQREAMQGGDDDDAGYSQRPQKRKQGPIDDDTLAGIVRTAIENGRDYDRDQLQSARLKAWRFYKGDMSEDMPPNDNGSEVVSFDVRDMVHAVMPSIEKIFFGTDDVIMFEAELPSDEPWVTLASRYVAKMVRDRLGHVGLRSVIMDCCLSKIGNVMWYWDDATKVKTEQYTGLDEAAFGLATEAVDDKTTVEVIEKTQRQMPPDPMEVEAAMAAAQQTQGQPGAQPPQIPQSTTVIDCIVRYTSKTRHLCIEAFPPEERICDPRGRSPETSNYRGRMTIKKVFELVAMGYERDEVIEHANADAETDPDISQDNAVRQPADFNEIGDDIPDEDYRDVTYCELWIKCDRDGDGVAELIKVCTIGSAYHVVHEETADQVQMAEFQIIPLPHTHSGRALADNLIDIQMIKTGCWRGVMESLPHSIYPRYVGVEGRVNWDDLLDNSPGMPIRVKDVGAAVPFTVDFVGKAAIDVMQYVDDNVRDARTGISKAAQGLDPDALQSTPAAAANAMIGATQTQLEDYARMFGETGMKALYKGLLREIVMNQRDSDFVKINGRWESVDPRPWNAELSVSIDVAGGTQNSSQKMMALGQIAQSQNAAMTQMGPGNPLVSLENIYNVQADMARIAGFRNVSRYWGDPSSQPDWKPTPPQPAPDPSAALADAELKKAQMQDDTKRYQLQLDDDRERDKNEANVVLETLKIAAPLGIIIDPNPIIQAMRVPRPPSTLPAPPNPHNPPPGAPQPGQQPPQGVAAQQ